MDLEKGSMDRVYEPGKADSEPAGPVFFPWIWRLNLSRDRGSVEALEQEIARLNQRIADLEAEKTCLMQQKLEGDEVKSILDRTMSKLKRSNEELEEFAYIASHDLQEPLRKIISFGERLESRVGPTLDEKNNSYLTRMIAAADRMRKLIESLLHYSRINTRGKEFKREDLNEVMAEVLEDMEINIAQRQAKVQVDPLPVVLADRIQMRQLFQNLLANAIKFSQTNIPPLIQVTAKIIDNSLLELRFRDNGIGFDEKNAQDIFIPFYKLHGREEYEGTGIGLSICEKIVHRHKGTIRAHSVPGNGATFIILLPLHPGEK